MRYLEPYKLARNFYFSDRVLKSSLQLSRDIRLKGAALKEGGVDVIDLAGYLIESPYGEVESHIENIRAAVQDALKNGWPKPDLRGIRGLRTAISEMALHDLRVEVDSESEILVTGGGSMQAIYNVMQATINSGDEVITFVPGLTYDEHIRMAGGRPVLFQLKEEEGFSFNFEDVERAVTERTKMLVVNSPHNPTGHVAGKNELEGLADIAKKHDLLVLSDEVLWKWVYNDYEHLSIATISDMQDRTIIASSSTKNGMFDWRIGWLIANEALVRQVEKIAFWQNEFSPPLLQIAAEAHLRVLDEWIPKVRKTMQEKMNLIYDGLSKIERISCVKPQGGLTVFPNIGSVCRSSTAFANNLLDAERVLVSPGIAYAGESHIRVGYSPPKEQIKDAVERIERFVKSTIKER